MTTRRATTYESTGPVNIMTGDLTLFSGDTYQITPTTCPAWTDVASADVADTIVARDSTCAFSVGGLQIDTTPPVVQTDAVGKMIWNDTDGTIQFLAKGGNVVVEIGQIELLRVKNDSGSPFTAGQAVYISGSNGTNMLTKLASASAESTSAGTIGIVAEPIAANGHGFVITFGVIHNINTLALTEGAPVWLSTTSGQLTSTRPSAPNHGVLLGFCLRQHASVGAIFVRVDNGWELDELHNVLISAPSNGQALTYDGTAQVWKNTTVSGSDPTKLPLTGGTLTGNLAVTVTQSAPTTVAITNTSANSAAEAGVRATSGAGSMFVGMTSNASSRGVGGMVISAESGSTFPMTFWTNGLRRMTVTGAEGYLALNRSTATARLHIAAGTVTGNTAPLKIDSGTVMATPEDGAVEYNGTKWYTTIGSDRQELLRGATYSPTLTPTAIPANSESVQTFTVSGLIVPYAVKVSPPASMAGMGIMWARVSASNTLEIGFRNFTAGSLTPPSGTWRILAARN